ncbi:hypothetical protein TUMSATVNIG1_47590 [Vibrio nigripulchritudo]|uniref:DUF2846 domain-containing protein n=1 Tax=Vibrio nigripulchritudo TaxID=28173 RepID=UPI00190C42D7|nr:DUF2846 domain-containing protein [Vibrio nigripulchritudo]BCL72787.1 hypothetical protein VNTUMSATTG_47240 [Vibrio nigripulchritudo]BDU34150.1 hypothetical protein TUMSATVNIG1_47590 [Vibrio nigripulchritudo]
MKKVSLLLSVLALGLSGCASVLTVSEGESKAAKSFETPEGGNAGIYVFRNDSPVGAALKKDVFINGECVGETAPGVFFYEEVEGGKEHVVDTESEFSPNSLKVFAEKGKLYFVQQFIKMGVFVGGAGVELVDEEEGKAEVAKYDMAVKGNCSK